MQSKGALFFKVLLNRYHAGSNMQNFIRAMPQEDSTEILAQPTNATEPQLLLTLTQEQLHNTHYSWLVPVIKQMAISLQPFIVASLPHASRLSHLLNIPIENLSVSSPAKKFFLHILWKTWNPSSTLPFNYLPDHPLLALGKMSKAELVEFIDFLALYDLAETIRHIVNKKDLKAIYEALTSKQLQFLRVCLHQKEKVAAPKIDLSKWHGDPQKLQNVLHHRGLLRLGKALSGQHPDFLWFITHKLDIGRGTILSKHLLPNEIPRVTAVLVQQIIFLINFLKKKTDS